MKEKITMSENHDETGLSHWIDDYKAPGARATASPLDDRAIATTLKAQSRKLLLEGAGVVLSSAALTSFGVYLAMRTQKMFVLVGASMFLAVAMFSAVGWAHTHRGTFRVSHSGTDAFLMLARRRAKAALAWNRASRTALGVFMVCVAAWAPFVLQGRAAFYAAEPWRAVVGFGGAFVIFGFAWQQLGKEITAAKRAYEELRDTSEGSSNERT